MINFYKFDEKSLLYKKVPIRIKNILYSIFIILSLGFLSMFALSTFIDTPKEKKLKKETKNLLYDISMMRKRIYEIDALLEEMRSVDSNIYEALFETSPIYTSDIQEINNLDSLYNIDYRKIVNYTHIKIQELEEKMLVHSKHLEKTYDLVLKKQKMLTHIPAIQPISNKDLKRTASGWGYRIHPIYKIRKFHYGIDFSAKVGTPVYSTGNGKIEFAGYTKNGYGYVVIINHGYGYKTLYAHLNSVEVKSGRVVKRGDIIAKVGNTGVSTGPHLHYEVRLNGKRVNPIHYFVGDLTPAEYDKMIKISSSMNKTFD